MHLSTPLTALIIGIYSVGLVQGSEITKFNRRINRLKSYLPNEQSVTGQTTEASSGATMAEEAVINNQPSTFENLVEVAAAATSINIKAEEGKKEEEEEEEKVQVVAENFPVLSLEDRRVDVFDSLYLLYEKAIGRYCSRDEIEWRRVNVQNWPKYIDMSDMNKWSEEDVEFLNCLISTNSIIFKPIIRMKKNCPAPLVCIRGHISAQATEEVNVPFDSDDESLTSLPSILVSVPRPKPEINAAAIASVESTGTASVDKAPAKTLKSIPKKKLVIKRSDFKSAKVDTDASANLEKKEALLNDVLQIYRRDTDRLDAKEVDWSLFKVLNLNNHVLPFSTGFETEEDIASLQNLMKKKIFGFHNPQNLAGRRAIIYERLYKIYKQVPGLSEIDPFIIKWNQIDVQGWPEGVNHSSTAMKPHEIELIERLLDAGDIKFTLKRAEKSKRTIKRTKIVDLPSSDEEDEYIIESSPSNASIEEFIDSSEEKEAVALLIARNKRKREARSVDEPIKIKKVAISKETNMTNQVSDFANEPVDQVANLQNELVLVLENLSKAKETFSQSDRHKRIISEIMKCFNLLQRHANNEILEVSAKEILEFLEIFQKALAEIRPDGEIDALTLKKFVINAIKLRARLAGIKYTKEKGRRVFKIPLSRIRDQETFGFLQHTESRWINELDILEFALDSEDLLITS